MGGVVAFLDEVVVDLFGGKVDVIDMVVLLLQQRLVVIQFAGDRYCADDFDLSAFVDQDVGGVNVPDLFLQVLELTACTHNIVQ